MVDGGWNCFMRARRRRRVKILDLAEELDRLGRLEHAGR
jgi:hypothetical protein